MAPRVHQAGKDDDYRCDYQEAFSLLPTIIPRHNGLLPKGYRAEKQEYIVRSGPIPTSRKATPSPAVVMRVMAEPLDTTGMMLGELKGQMRELIHNVGNMSMKLDGLTEKVIGAQEIPAKVADLERRVVVLETDMNRRDGAMGFGGWLLKSPIVGWLVGMALTAWVVLRTKG